jgi:putative flippase GtrA
MPVIANVISTSFAMIFSFLMNKRLVFRNQSGGGFLQIVKFFVVTAFGLWVIQGAIINYCTSQWFGLADFSLGVLTTVHLQHIMSYTAVATNSAKAVAIVVSLTWNYILYKNLVFKHVTT